MAPIPPPYENPKTATYPEIELEIDGRLTHKDGYVAMARRTEPNSASSQFYICADDSNSYLDGEYAVFGRVIHGNQIYRDISNNAEVDDNDWPTKSIIIRDCYILGQQ